MLLFDTFDTFDNSIKFLTLFGASNFIQITVYTFDIVLLLIDFTYFA